MTRLSKQLPSFLLLLVATLLLIGSWLFLYQIETFFTESHLAGYYCCVTEQMLPAPGTPARMLSDFFATSPGEYLPSLIFILVNIGIFVAKIRQERANAWLPLAFVFLNGLYFIVGLLLVSATWSISMWWVGPLTGAYKGYAYTWYGIVAHLILWGVFFLTLSKISIHPPAMQLATRK